jgi:hypothetical protein
MSIPNTTLDLENRKFVECPTASELVSVRVCFANPEEIGVPPQLLPDGWTAMSIFSEVSAVAASTLTDVLTYTVPLAMTFVLTRIEVSGGNVATFDVTINGTRNALKRTWWTRFNEEFEYPRLELVAGDVLRVRVIHERPEVADFEARIIGIEGAE